MSDWVLTDGERFIKVDRHGKYVPTSSAALADFFTRKQAENILKNRLPKALRTIFRVELLNAPPKDIKPVSSNDMEKTEKVMVAENVQRWLDKVADLNGLAGEATERKRVLDDQLAKVDQEIQDLLHYCEFCNLNAAQGYKAYKMIRERRIKRRSIKNEMTVLSIILGKKIGESVSDEIMSSVRGMDNRHYEPRVLKDLFDT